MTRLPILSSWPVAALSLALYIGHALAEPATSGALVPSDGLQANPQAAPGLLGNGYLGRALGIGEGRQVGASILLRRALIKPLGYTFAYEMPA